MGASIPSKFRSSSLEYHVNLSGWWGAGLELHGVPSGGIGHPCFLHLGLSS